MTASTCPRKLLLAAIRPLRYDICLEPDLDQQVFAGRVEIYCSVSEPTQVIQLHGKHVSITSASLSCGGASWDVLESLSHVEDDDVIEIRAPKQLEPAETITIILSYTGRLKDELEGFYRSTYDTGDGKEQQLAVTFMEPTCARQVFPCFDEPHQKAQFTVSAIVDPLFLCVSNMPISRTETMSDSKKLVVFEQTPLMSTYLVGLVAGPLCRVESTECRFPLSVICPNETENEAKFALKLASDGLHFFEKLFDSQYPLPKLDLVAVPDFASGAMENWGLITFRTNHLLLVADDASLDRKQVIARVILHEISHSWFGNLVTMKYWDGLWLKEGFATLLAWYAADKLFPEWHLWNNYVVELLQEALELDALNNSHSVELLVPDPTKAKQMFDAISYRKGCAILKMLLGEMGEEAFFDGLKLYIHRHEFGSTESDDLWDALQECTDYDVAGAMQVWTKEPGFPVVRVTEECKDGADSGDVATLRLRQDRFVASRSDPSVSGEVSSTSPQIYPLRISVRSETGVDTYEMLEREIAIPTQGKALQKINADHDGFFRTCYSSAHLTKLTEAALKDQLTTRDCIGLLADVSALTATGINKTSELLGVCLGFKAIAEFPVWRMIDQNLTTVMSIWKFKDKFVGAGLRKLSANILGPKAHDIGWTMLETDDESQMEFKANIFSSAGLVGDKDVLGEARRLFAARLAGDEKSIAPQLRYEVFGIVAAHGGMKDVEALLDIWKSSPNSEEKYLALECLGRVRSAELTRWVLGNAFSGDVKPQDIYLLLWLVGSSADSAVALWEWTKQNWSKVEEAVTASMQANMLQRILGSLHTEDQINDAMAFFAARDTKAYDQALGQALEGMATRRAWAERDGDDVRAWLENNGYM